MATAPKNAAGSAKAGAGSTNPEGTGEQISNEPTTSNLGGEGDSSEPKVTASEAQVAWVAGLEFPVELTLRNNGPVAHAEPATRQFLAAGGSQVVTVHDETVATLLVQNLAELNAINHGNQALLVIDGVESEVVLKG